MSEFFKKLKLHELLQQVKFQRFQKLKLKLTLCCMSEFSMHLPNQDQFWTQVKISFSDTNALETFLLSFRQL